ncbi:MAG: Rpn family recombination-promoting nuclease/putative transposase [Verrucomicrobiales bacterium]
MNGTTEPGRSPHNPHDHLFKFAFGPPDRARELIATHVGGALGAAIARSAFEPLPNDFIGPSLDEGRCDLLFRIRLPGQEPARCLLLQLILEHQRTCPPMMGARIDAYRAAAWARLLKDDPGLRLLPPVIAIVFYNGSRPWHAPTEVGELIATPDDPALADQVRAFQPRYRYQVIDLPDIDPDLIKGGLAIRATQSLMRAVGLGAAKDWLMRYGGMLVDIMSQPDLDGLLRALVRYMLASDSDLKRHEVRRVLLASPAKAAENTVMTIAQEIRQEGLQEGRREGQIEILLSLLATRFGEVPPDLTQRLQSLESGDLRDLARDVFAFSGIGDLRSWLAVR